MRHTPFDLTETIVEWEDHTLDFGRQSNEDMGGFQTSLPMRENFMATGLLKRESQLQEAERLRLHGDRDQAEQIYRHVLQGDPNDPNVLHLLGTLLAEKLDMTQSLQLLERSAQLAPDSAVVQNSLGKLLLAQGHYGRAIVAFDKAVRGSRRGPQELYADSAKRLAESMIGARRIDQAFTVLTKFESQFPDDPEVQRLRERGVRRLLPSWHFPMLFDQARNAAYQRALERHVTSESVVLDIGSGTGLLAMMAARAGAKQVIACEVVKTLAETAREIVCDNGYSDHVKVFASHSTALRVGEHLPRRADLLVSEIVDSELLGEGVLASITHAKKELLAENATIIPEAANLWVQLIELENTTWVSRPLADIAGFNLGRFEKFHPKPSRILVDCRVEPYRLLSDRHMAREYNFGSNDFSPARQQLEIPVTQTGMFDGVVIGFDLKMDEQETVTSGPGGQLGRGWQTFVWLNPNPRKVQVGTVERIRVGTGTTVNVVQFEDE